MKTVRVKTTKRRQWSHSGVFIIKCEHVSHFVPIAVFEQANVFWVHIENTSTFEDEFRYIMPYAAVH